VALRLTFAGSGGPFAKGRGIPPFLSKQGLAPSGSAIFFPFRCSSFCRSGVSTAEGRAPLDLPRSTPPSPNETRADRRFFCHVLFWASFYVGRPSFFFPAQCSGSVFPPRGGRRHSRRLSVVAFRPDKGFPPYPEPPTAALWTGPLRLGATAWPAFALGLFFRPEFMSRVASFLRQADSLRLSAGIR